MRTHPDDLIDLTIFAQVVEDRSFTAAAKALSMSKSALSARVARLEERAGVRLLHRTTRRVTLTDAGAALFPSCARLAAGASDAAHQLSCLGEESERDVRGLVRVSADTNVARLIIPSAVAAACAKFPLLSIELIGDDNYVDVIHGGFDVVIRSARKLDPQHVGRKLAVSERIVVAAPSYLAKHGTPASIDELLQHNCLRYRFGEPRTEWRFFEKGRRTSSGAPALRSIEVSGSFVANNDGPLIAACVAGVGITVMAQATVHEELERGALVRILADARLESKTVWALHPWRRRAPPRVRAVIDAIASEFAKSPRYRAP